MGTVETWSADPVARAARAVTTVKPWIHVVVVVVFGSVVSRTSVYRKKKNQRKTKKKKIIRYGGRVGFFTPRSYSYIIIDRFSSVIVHRPRVADVTVSAE